MLGRSVGLTDEQLAHLGTEDPPPELFSPSEQAIIRFASVSTQSIKIDQAVYDELARHFSVPQIMEITFLVGLSGLVNRFHATFLTDVDASTLEVIGDGGLAGAACFAAGPA